MTTPTNPTPAEQDLIDCLASGSAGIEAEELAAEVYFDRTGNLDYPVDEAWAIIEEFSQGA